MSFSERTKEEMLQNLPGSRCCRQAFLGAFLWLNGNSATEFSFSGTSVGRHLAVLLNQLGIKEWGMGVSRHGHRHIGRLILGQRFRIAVPKQSSRMCCVRSFLRGSFLAKGHISAPQKNYHIEIRALHKSQAVVLQALLRRVELRGEIYRRRQAWVVYLKGGEQAERFLNVMGAQQSFLGLEEIRALKETKNAVRRKVNYESANLSRIAQASARQRGIFERLRAQKKWNTLPPALRFAAEWRLRYPSLGLEELAKRFGISKSALNHRFRRLEALRLR